MAAVRKTSRQTKPSRCPSDDQYAWETLDTLLLSDLANMADFLSPSHSLLTSLKGPGMCPVSAQLPKWSTSSPTACERTPPSSAANVAASLMEDFRIAQALAGK